MSLKSYRREAAMREQLVRDKKWFKCMNSLLVEAFLTLRNQEDMGHKWIRVDFRRTSGKNLFISIDGNIGSKAFPEPEIVDEEKS